jgi:DNA recombination protein Rad52
MNQAAIHSAEVLARYEAEQILGLHENDPEHPKVVLRSGQNISSQPYGEKKEIEVNMDSETLVKYSAEESQGEGEVALYDDRREASTSRIVLPYPASTIISGPGIDAAGQLATMQAKLNQRLGPEYISTRQGPGGGKLSYLEGWKAIDLSNEVFGFNGWSSSIVRMDVDFMDESEGHKWSVGVSAVMRITLRDGTYHEDIGYGHCENVKMKHQALEKARKEASTDALKRALRTFGRMLGNCLYDKKFIETASKMKVTAPQYDMNELKRTSAAPQQAPPAPAPAPAARATPTVPPQRPPPVQNKQPPQPIRQQQQTFTRPPPAPVRVPAPASDQSTKAIVDSAPAQVDQQPRPVTPAPQSNDARLREERKAMAAAKQAELRARKEKEETARQEVANSKATTSLPLRASVENGQAKAATSSNSSRRVSNDEDDIENVDEYDLALMAADLSDGADLIEEVVSSGKGTRSAVKPLSFSNADDSGIGIVEQVISKQHRPVQRNGPTAASPAAHGKGRFIDSSPTTHNVSGKLPSSSPKFQIPVKGGRRLSLVGGSSIQLRSSQEQQRPPGNSQRSKANRTSTTMQPPANVNNNNRYSKRSGSSGYTEIAIKRPRPSP